jgi:uncharacterized protein YbjT (DUF2867 family)
MSETPHIHYEDLFCQALATRPCPEAGTILVTGATGYVGGRLVPELIARGYRVRVMLRAALPEQQERWPGAEIVTADAGAPAALRAALHGVHTAYYLIHSLLLGPRRFESADTCHAAHFRDAAAAEGVRRIIYLGGLGDTRTVLSPHLRSRSHVAEELQAGPVPATVLRAAIIIGAGSASYEIIQHLVRNLPLIPIPTWARTRCQPIAIRDVIRLLVGVLETPATAGQSYDIGGTEVLTYEEMLRTLSRTLGRRCLFVRMPRFLSSVPPYAYLTGLLTPVPAPITRSLMESLRNDVVCQDDRIRQLIPFQSLSYPEAIRLALTREERDEVHSRWSDAYPPTHELARHLADLPAPPRYTTSYDLVSNRPAAALFRSFCTIGGTKGWLHGNWMWRLRGTLDRLLLGVGTARGRRSRNRLRINDVIDFWRVENLVADRCLLLRAEMKLPGEAWLEFTLSSEQAQTRLRITAYYDTRTWYGRLYWYLFLPFHGYLFANLIRQIEQRS